MNFEKSKFYFIAVQPPLLKLQIHRDRETHRKTLDDPLTAIQAQLRQRTLPLQATPSLPLADLRSHRGEQNSQGEPLREARLSREAVERARAEALIRCAYPRILLPII